MLIKSSQAIATAFIPNLNLAIIGSSSKQLMVIEADRRSFMHKAFLVDDITLRLPFPHNYLSESLQTQTDPSA